MKPSQFLGYYATQFDTVEADVTYYRVPDVDLVDGWKGRTPEGFLIAAKFPRSVVHCGNGQHPDGEKVLDWFHCQRDTETFLEMMDRLRPKCGPLVLQFPYFNRTAFRRKQDFVMDRLGRFLGRLPDKFRYAVEIRNRTWIDEDLLHILRVHKVALVLVDMLYMPHPADLAEEFDIVTTDFYYARLIGDRKAVEAKAGGKFDRIVVDQTERLGRWAHLIRTRASSADGFVYANNHYAGHEPATVRHLQALVSQRP